MPIPPPLKEALSSDEYSEPPSNAIATYREIFPWNLWPPGTGIVMLGLTPPPPPPNLPAAEDDSYRIERRELSYLCIILSAWQRGVIAWEAVPSQGNTFPTYDQLKNDENLPKKYIDYEHAGHLWRSSYFIKFDRPATKLIIHLANDGFLYMNPADIDVISKENRRHKNTCRDGWFVFKRGDPQERTTALLSDFKAFAVEWFGTDQDQIRQSILYNPSKWRIDICFQHKETEIGLEFSFEADWPVPAEDYWWD